MAEENKSNLPRPEVDPDCCKGCGRCASACPRGCLALQDTLNKMGIKPVGYKGSGCIGCAICFYNCPEPYALRVLKA